MDIIQLRKKQLNEVSYRYQRSLNGGGMAYLGKRRGGIPGVMLSPADGKPLSESDHIFAVVINQAAGKKLWSQAVENNQYGITDPNSPEYRFINIWRDVNNSNNAPDLRNMSEFPKVFKIVEMYGRGKMYKYLTTDLRMPVALYVSVFGDPPEMTSDEHFTEFHDARVFIPDNARAASKKAMMDLLETLYQHLRANGFGFLFHGDIRFIRLNGKTVGVYNLGTKTIAIQPNAKKNKNVVFTMLHEFSHKYWFEYMDEAARKKVKDKFKELRRNGIQHEADTTERDASVAEIRANITPGMKVNYLGRKKYFKKHTPFIIKTVEGDSWSAYSEGDPNEFARVSGKLASFTTKNWEIPAIKVHKPEPKSKYDVESEQWFPTSYSTNDAEEWFAELMAIYLLDHLSGSPEQFIEEVFGV